MKHEDIYFVNFREHIISSKLNFNKGNAVKITPKLTLSSFIPAGLSLDLKFVFYNLVYKS